MFSVMCAVCDVAEIAQVIREAIVRMREWELVVGARGHNVIMNRKRMEDTA